MDTIFFVLSKAFWFSLSPDHLFVFALILLTVLLWAGRIQGAKRLATAISLSACLLCTLSIGDWLLAPLETRFPSHPELPTQVDGIIVLSGAEQPSLSAHWQQPQVNEASERLVTFVKLMQIYPEAKAVFTGGSGNVLSQDRKAADVAEAFFDSLTIKTQRIVFERHARNTFENAKNSKPLAQPSSGEKWLLVTTAWHMPRAVGVFRQQGWPVIAYPVDYRINPFTPLRMKLDFAGNLDQLKIATKEWIGLVAYYLSGKSSALLPRP